MTNDGVVFLLLLETQPPAGLRSGIALSEATLRLSVGEVARLNWLLELLELSGVLTEVFILSVVVEYWAPALNGICIALKLPAGPLRGGSLPGGVAELMLLAVESSIATVCESIISVVRACSDSCDI